MAEINDGTYVVINGATPSDPTKLAFALGCKNASDRNNDKIGLEAMNTNFAQHDSRLINVWTNTDGSRQLSFPASGKSIQIGSSAISNKAYNSYVGDGVRTSFEIPISQLNSGTKIEIAGTLNEVTSVKVNNKAKTLGTDYILSGNTVTFVEAPPNKQKVQIVYKVDYVNGSLHKTKNVTLNATGDGVTTEYILDLLVIEGANLDYNIKAITKVTVANKVVTNYEFDGESINFDEPPANRAKIAISYQAYLKGRITPGNDIVQDQDNADGEQDYLSQEWVIEDNQSTRTLATAGKFTLSMKGDGIETRFAYTPELTSYNAVSLNSVPVLKLSNKVTTDYTYSIDYFYTLLQPDGQDAYGPEPSDMTYYPYWSIVCPFADGQVYKSTRTYNASTDTVTWSGVEVIDVEDAVSCGTITFTEPPKKGVTIAGEYRTESRHKTFKIRSFADNDYILSAVEAYSANPVSNSTLCDLELDNNNPGSIWMFVPITQVSTGVYRIIPAAALDSSNATLLNKTQADSDFVMSVKSASTSANARVNLTAYSDDDSNYQKAIVQYDANTGRYTIANANSKLLYEMTNKNAASGNLVQGAKQYDATDAETDAFWFLVNDGIPTKNNGSLRETYEIRNFAATSTPRLMTASKNDEYVTVANQVIDSTAVKQQTDVYQRWIFEPDELYASDLAAPSEITIGPSRDAIDRVNNEIMFVGTKQLYLAWNCAGDMFQVRYNIRRQKPGEAIGDWEGWMNLRDGTTANNGWGPIRSYTEKFGTGAGETVNWEKALGNQKYSSLPLYLTMDRKNCDYIELQVQVRRFQPNYISEGIGMEGVDAHGAELTATFKCHLQPSLLIANTNPNSEYYVNKDDTVIFGENDPIVTDSTDDNGVSDIADSTTDPSDVTGRIVGATTEAYVGGINWSINGLVIHYASTYEYSGNSITLNYIKIDGTVCAQNVYFSDIDYHGELLVTNDKMTFLPLNLDGSTIEINYTWKTENAGSYTDAFTTSLLFADNMDLDISGQTDPNFQPFVRYVDGEGNVQIEALSYFLENTYEHYLASSNGYGYTILLPLGYETEAYIILQGKIIPMERTADNTEANEYRCLPPFGVPYKLSFIIRNSDDLTWGSYTTPKMSPLQTHFFTWNWGSNFCTLAFGLGDSPKESNQISTRNSSNDTTGRTYPIFRFGKTRSRNLSVSGVVIPGMIQNGEAEDFDALSKANHAVFRSPRGDWYNVAITAVNINRVADYDGYYEISITQEAESP